MAEESGKVSKQIGVDIKSIKTEADYEVALAEIERLFDAEPGTAEGDRLEALVSLVEVYEDEHYDLPLPTLNEGRGLSRKGEVMKALHALERFKTFAAQNEKLLDSLSPSEAIELMVAFYTEVRAEDCNLDADGDMLLFQWGTYNWGTGEWFEYNITRQFIFSDANGEGDEQEAEDCIWQLSMTLKFTPTPELKSLPAGNRWCERPDEIADFLSFIRSCQASELVKTYNSEITELTFGDAE